MSEVSPPVTKGTLPDFPLPQVNDPALVVAYFFNGSKETTQAKVDSVYRLLLQDLRTDEDFDPPFLRADTRFLYRKQYLWSRESRATLAQFFIKPSEVLCIQVGMPLRDGPVSAEEALLAWREMESRLGEVVEQQIESLQVQAPDLYWGSSRLYWALSDDLATHPDQTSHLVVQVQKLAASKGSDGKDVSTTQRLLRLQAYVPQEYTASPGTLWRLDEPAADVGRYRAGWLLFSPHSQNDPVMRNYILNGRFAVGEAYLCKAHYQAGLYPPIIQDLRSSIQHVQGELRVLVDQEISLGDISEGSIRSTQGEMRQKEERIHQVAVAYSELLDAIATIDRLHLTVKTNLDNYEKTVQEFVFWRHPAAHTEILRLKGILDQIEHDQRSRRISLEAFQVAIETVRAGIDLTAGRISAARLSLEQKQAEQEKLEEKMERYWDILTVIIGTVLGVSQIIPLAPHERWETFAWSLPLVVMLLLVLVVVRYRARRRR